MNKMELSFKKEKETKNTVRYMEEGADPCIGFVYIKKTKLGTPYPNELKVTIEA
jgi:hypothetical protein